MLLIMVCCGTCYGMIITKQTKLIFNHHHQSSSHDQQFPTKIRYDGKLLNDGKSCLVLSHLLCLSLFFATLCLGTFHLYLVFTAQTTIEVRYLIFYY